MNKKYIKNSGTVILEMGKWRKVCVMVLALLSIVSISTSFSQELLFIEPKEKLGFHFPYFLFIPDSLTDIEPLNFIIEPNNSGIVNDTLQKHIVSAKYRASKDFYIGNFVSRNLGIPLLVPIFPRLEKDWQVYTHDLDRDAMLQRGNNLERIDKQLIQMFEDARRLLHERGIQSNSEFFLTGFSASGSFANRFTALHPEKVAAIAAGGTGGLLILPRSRLGDDNLYYPIGIADLDKLTGKKFDETAFKNTPQYYFMGDLDTNDSLPYQDAYSEIERMLILTHFHKTDLQDRWNTCEQFYKDAEIKSEFKSYAGIGHEHPEVVKHDILRFFSMITHKQTDRQ